MADEFRCLIQHYFHQGYEYQVILDFLSLHHGITISLSTLKRRLRDYQLKKQQRVVDEQELRDIVQQEISGPGVLLGYIAVWHSLRLIHHIIVPRRKVTSILRVLNPDAVGLDSQHFPSHSQYIILQEFQAYYLILPLLTKGFSCYIHQLLHVLGSH